MNDAHMKTRNPMKNAVFWDVSHVAFVRANIAFLQNIGSYKSHMA
jgi:hypothetical protein